MTHAIEARVHGPERRSRARQNASDAIGDFVGIERFGDNVKGTGSTELSVNSRTIVRCKKDRLRLIRRSRTHAMPCIKPAEPGHNEIKQHEVRLVRGKRRQGFFSACACNDVYGDASQQRCPEYFAYERIIIHNHGPLYEIFRSVFRRFHYHVRRVIIQIVAFPVV
ncbi:MAG: hypothetical protein RLN70_01555 [Rhodospirillaceae bacterium]